MPNMTDQSTSNITPENVQYLLTEHPIQCHQCGNEIGSEKLDCDCYNCGFSNEESFVQWVLEREKINE